MTLWCWCEQKVTYKTRRPFHSLKTVAEVVGSGVEAQKEAKWKERIVVPPLPYSTLESSALITIEYYIEVSRLAQSANLSISHLVL